MSVTILQGDCRAMLRTLPADSVQCVVTSPPYWGLRDYGVAGQLGMEPTYQEHIAVMVEVFREVRRVLKPDGTMWVNYGDSYASSVNGRSAADTKAAGGDDRTFRDKPFSTVQGVLKPKDLCGIPWRFAFALQDDGWFLRQDIIWSKPNPMPESIRDRCTKAHEYVFLFSKSGRYFFDGDAIREPAAPASVARWNQDIDQQRGSNRVPGKTNGTMKAVGGPRSLRNSFARESKNTPGDHDQKPQHRPEREPVDYSTETRNRRSVWSIPTQPFSEAHFATFPPELPELCIKAGSREGDTILDPFFGAGTTGLVADRLRRHCIGIELNPDYAAMAARRIDGDAPLFSPVSVEGEVAA